MHVHPISSSFHKTYAACSFLFYPVKKRGGGVLGGLSVADRRLITRLMKTLPEGGVRAAASDVAPLLDPSGILSFGVH